LIPGEEAYFDVSWPEKRLFVIGLKTTCKDRWRQVLDEGRRVRTKHIVTLQQGITHLLHFAPQSSRNLLIPQAAMPSIAKT